MSFKKKPAYTGESITLPGAKRRYQEKMEMCGGVDSYVLVPGEFGDGGISSYPPMTMVHITMFLVIETSFHSEAQMKAYKAMEAHNFFSSGFLKQPLVKTLLDKRVLNPNAHSGSDGLHVTI